MVNNGMHRRWDEEGEDVTYLFITGVGIAERLLFNPWVHWDTWPGLG